MPKRLCTMSGCKSIVDVPVGFRGSPRCDKHSCTQATPKRVYEHHFHNGKNIYKSQQWVKLRASYVQHQPLCEHCLSYGIITPGVIVDHIKEIEDGGAIFDFSNLQHLCRACHNTKTGREASKRNRNRKNQGFGKLSDF